VRLVERVRRLVKAGRRQYSAHAIGELAADGILIKPLVDAIDTAVVVEEYPDYHKGPCVLVLQRDETGGAGPSIVGDPPETRMARQCS
jgi:hypothetical protein